ncbi:MAG TPA: FtsX-like permease family protein [Kiloniellales bacterium]|nr:FtsX-like permease family protein [Kiloniellales bacterium]
MDLALAWRFTRRELRGGFKGFRVFLAALALGVAALATVGTVSADLLASLDRDARALLGGEAELRLFNRAFLAEERNWLEANSRRLSETAEMRAMARAGNGERRLVELKAVDTAYPLYGALELAPPTGGADALAEIDGRFGAAVESDLLERLGIAVGEEIRIGEQSFVVRATIAREPDRTASAFTFGPRVLIALDSLAGTGLDGPGSLVYRHVRVDLPEGESLAAWRERLDRAFPEAGWRVAGLDRAAPGVERFIRQVRLFMSLVGLTALLVGGVGVANGVAAHLESRRDTIATLKCLGASGGLVARIYFLQVLALATIGIAIGLAVGAAAPVLVAPFLSEAFNLDLGGAPALFPLLLAGLMGLLTAALFAFRPLARAQRLSAAGLFRGHLEQRRQRLPGWLWPAVIAAALLLAFLAIATHHDRLFAAGFVGGAVLVLAAFRLAATGVMGLAKRIPRPRRTTWRLALANLHRPGTPTPSVVISLGLGLTVLAAVALIQANISRQVLQEIPAEAPTFYFIDLQNEQVDRYDALVRAHPGVTDMNRVPMLRGRITAINGKSPEQLAIPPQVSWIFNSDRGLTWSRAQPEGVTLSGGEWWPADYAGPPLVSLDQELGQALGLKLGDTITVNVYGRDVTAAIASFRPIEWAELRINFVMIFSPGLLEGAPASHIATVRVDDANASALERQVTDAFPNVSAIRVADALSGFAELLDSIAAAVGGTGSVTVLAGLIVLAGAVAAGERRRRYDAVVLKVLGATRSLLLGSLALGFALLGLATAAIAAVLGSIAAAVILELVMEQEFTLLPGPLLWTLAAGLAVTLLFGLAGTVRALGARAAPLLRNE